MTANGALSTGAGPAFQANGTWITGGSATTTKPYFLLETTGATSTGWSTSGTGLGVNAASGFVGNLFDFELNGTSKAKFDASAGTMTIAGNIAATGNISGTGSSSGLQAGTSGFISWASSKVLMSSPADGKLLIQNSATTGFSSLVLGPTAPATIGTAPTHGQVFTVMQAEELLTIAAAPTSTTTMQVPAGAILLSVSVRVTTVIPTAATFTVVCNGITFNTAAVSTAATTTDAGTNANIATVPTYPYIGTAAGVVITPNLTPADNSGRVRVTVSYILITPPTS